MKSNSARYPELDYLRGIACLMVIGFHYLSRGPMAGWTGSASYPSVEAIARYGHFGVHLFFIISGFVIYRSANGRSTYSFFTARFWRLYPAYWICIVATALVVEMFDANTFRVSIRDLLWNFTMFQQWVKAKHVDGAYWSLMVEMVFYLYIGLAIFLKIINRTYSLVCASLAVSAINIYLNSFWIDVLFLGRWAPYFAIGILVSKIREGDLSARPKILLACALLLALLRIYFDAQMNRYIDMLIVFLLTGLFVLISAKERKISATQGSHIFGVLTYPMYLLHQNIGYILLAALSVQLGANLSLALVFTFMIALSFAVHELVEKRLTNFFRQKKYVKLGRSG
jgi:peptidoglycan/LPS O-acetylase OafA/YrhL